MNALIINNLRVTVGGAPTPSSRPLARRDTPPQARGEILNGVSLTVKPGEVHALMGPNGSGKSTLAMTLMGHPGYTVIGGSATYCGKNVLKLTPEARAKLGLFLSFQHPIEVPGVSFMNFLRTAYVNARERQIPPADFLQQVRKKAKLLGFDTGIVERNVNEGFSGGEKKRAEVLQMAVLEPTMAILDETDSGLDIDSLKTVAGGIEKLRSKKFGILVITHYQRILKYLKPDRVHVMVDGTIVASGDGRLAHRLERSGYAAFKREA